MSWPPPERQRDLLIAVAFAVAAAVFRLPGLGLPAEEVFDEVYHAKSALQYLQGEPPVEWVHPPLAKHLIAVGVKLFGYQAWAWRLMPALAGIALAPVFYALARSVLPTRRAAVLAGVLLLSDGVYLVQSRIAMTNIFAVLFQVTAVLLAVRLIAVEPLPVGGMAALGVCLGLALATRWTSLWATGFVGLILLATRRLRLLRPRELALLVMAFVAIPVVIYVVSYLPLPVLRPGLEPWNHEMAKLWDLQKEVWNYHAHLQAEHPYFSKWYTWPWLYRPTWYHFKIEDGYIRGIVALGNPALWWLSVPVTLWALVTGAQARDPRRLFTGLGFVCLYLPWGFSPRTLNYSHYLFEAIPYACLSLGLFLDELWSQDRLLAVGYLALVVALFLFFFPFLAGVPIPQDWYYFNLGRGIRPWTWFPTWV
ncbi:MAG TPA: phospholipid carrier-dependent glycosyltransferase [Vicinamibacteria bacterium]